MRPTTTDRSARSDSRLATAYRQNFRAILHDHGRHRVPAAVREDAAQDAFLIAWRQCEDSECAPTSKAWLKGIARNVARHHHRAHVRREQRHARLSPPPWPETPEDTCELLQLEAVARQAMDSLEPCLRCVFDLHYLHSRSAAELAAELGISLATTYARLRRVREHFARACALPTPGRNAKNKTARVRTRTHGHQVCLPRPAA